MRRRDCVWAVVTAVTLLLTDPVSAALTFGAAASDRVTIANYAGVQNLTSMTAWAWIYPTTLTGSRRILSKTKTVATVGWQLAWSDASGNLIWQYQQVTTFSSCTQSAGSLTTNQWWFVAATYSANVSHLYKGDLTTAVAEPTDSCTAGVGAHTDDSTYSIYLANRADADQAFQGREGWAGVHNAVLTTAQLDAIRRWPWTARTRSCVLLMELGLANNATQPNRCASTNGSNTGTSISGHLLLMRYPLVVSP